MESGLSLDPYSVPQRHTFYDSDEDDSVEDKEEVLALHCSPGLTIKSRLLLVCVSATAITLAQSYLDVERDAVVCKISTTSAKKVIKGRCFSSRGSPENTSKEEVISDVCTASGDGKVTVCLQHEKLNSDFCNAWSEKLLAFSNPQQVVILHSLHLHELISGESLGDASSALYSLQTRSWTGKPLAAFLPPPNTIQGEAAAVLSQSQYQGVPASLAVMYHANSLTELERVQAMRHVLFNPTIASMLHLKSVAEGEKAVKKYVSPPRHDLDMLYT